MRKIIPWAAVAALAAPWAVTQAQEQPRDQPGEQSPEQHAAASTGGSQAGPQSAEERLSGTFELVGSSAQARARVDRAIDETVSHVSGFKRPFASGRLREKNPVRDHVRTEVANGNVTIEYGDASYTTRDGQWQTVTATGEQVQLLQQVVGDRIYQTFRAEDGEKVTVYSVSEDGNSLRLDVTLTSPQLPEPLRYQLEYRRTGGESGVAMR